MGVPITELAQGLLWDKPASGQPDEAIWQSHATQIGVAHGKAHDEIIGNHNRIDRKENGRSQAL